MAVILFNYCLAFVLLITASISSADSDYWTQGDNAKLFVNTLNVSDYYIAIDNITWLVGGAPNVWCDNQWHSPNDNSLTQTSKPILANGTHPTLGTYTSLTIDYTINASNTSSQCHAQPIILSFVYYSGDDVFEFKQYFPNGLHSTNIPQTINTPANGIHISMIPMTEFPVWSFNANDLLKSDLGYIEWQGRHVNDRTNFGVGLDLFEGGNEGGIVQLFENNLKRGNSLLISSSEQFMNGIFSIRTRRAPNIDILLNDTNFENSNDIKIVKHISDEQNCLDLCSNIHLWCNTWVYDTANKECHLKYNNRGQTPSKGYISGMLSNHTYFVSGIEGNITFVPQKYQISFMISAVNHKGIHASMAKFGTVLRKKYGTKRQSNGIIESFLGYWTDNGGYYYGSNPLTTAIAKQLFAAFRMNAIPVRYLQLDPFWYCGGHISEAHNIKWVADTRYFPNNGVFGLYDAIGNVPLLLYSAFWSPTTADYYNTNYGLNLQFSNGAKTNSKEVMSLPQSYSDSYAFYKLLTSLYANITVAFEIDWMDFEFGDFSVFTNGYNDLLNLSNAWLKGMNDANLELKQSIQFCMTLPNYILSSVMYSSVTNARCSEDNFPTNTNRWKVAYSALLIAAMDIKPFFDVLWTTSIQSGNKYGSNAMDVEMQAIIAVLLNGPFGIGDNVNMTNQTIIDRVCRSDGLLLHPSYSLSPIEAMFFNNSNMVSSKQNGEVWFTYANVSGLECVHSYIILSVDKSYMLTFEDLFPFPNESDEFIVYRFNDSNIDINSIDIYSEDLAVFNNVSKLDISTAKKPRNNPTHLHSWNLFNIIIVQPNEWVLLGELARYVSVSPQRFSDLKVLQNGLSVTVSGAINEKITVSFRTNDKRIIHKNVEFDQNGSDQIITVTS